MSPRRPKDPFAVDWSKSTIDEKSFCDWLRTELQNAQDARASYVAEGGWLDLYHLLYEQSEMTSRQGPWPNSANLTSWIGTQQVDAMGARVSQAICGVEPLCTVTGWGQDPQRTALVESVHEWQAVDEYLRDHLEDTIELSLIEGTVMLEVDERAFMRHTKRTITAVVATDQHGAPMFDSQETPQPILAQNPDGTTQEAGPNDASKMTAETVIEERNYACAGPQYRVLGGKDFLILPGHARNNTEVWGYAKRFYLTPVQLQQRQDAGTYSNIEELALSASDRQQRADETRRGITIEPQEGQTVQKELWEVHLCYDIDDDGADEWLIATISIVDDVLLRLEYDQLKHMRGVPFSPFPNPTSVYGMGLIQKLLTIIFEHTAYRNMAADKSAMAASAPVSRLTTAYWNPEEQPIGPQAVIDVRSHDEVKQLQFQDVPQSVFVLKRDVENAAERVGGLNDQSVIGVNPEGAPPSATQIQTTSQASSIRVDKVTRRLRQAVSKVYDIRHVIIKRMLAANGEAGMQVPDDVLQGMASRGVTVPTDGEPFSVKASDLDGKWTFKPKGSVQSSDKRFLLQNLNGLMQTIVNLAKMSPAFAQRLTEDPTIVTSLLDNALYIFDVGERQKIMDAFKNLAPPQPPPQAGPIPPAGQVPGQPLVAGPPQAHPTAPGAPNVPPEILAALAAAGHGLAPAPGTPASQVPHP